MINSSPKKDKEITIPLDDVVYSLYQSQDKIYPRNVKGMFSNWRWAMVWVTQLFFYGMPWINWGQRQALLFDLTDKRFFIFGLVFTPQDLIYLSFLLIISALSLFLFTAIAGRLWCGYTCPQTVYTEMFLWIESKVEGDRASRMKLDQSYVNKKKVLRKGLKHFLWVAVALWTGFTFVGYFTPIRELAVNVLTLSSGPWETFWMLFYGFATYGNAGFMREQVCKYMCPYARFQSAMFDKDTLMVTYDTQRGEPRGARAKNADLKAGNLGACIDCTMCVQVCPTGIDIRKGLQYECINCGLCADICNTVMDKVGYERGLIKYSTQNGMDNGWDQSQLIKRILRPRVLIYSAILITIITGYAYAIYNRPLVRVDVIKDRSILSRLDENGQLESVYRIKLTNASEELQKYKLSANSELPITLEFGDSDEGAVNIKEHVVDLQAREVVNLVVELKTPDGESKPGSYPVMFEIKSMKSEDKVIEKSNFIIPN
jgi:cytochrome c oxidase accessory protein FixG